MAGVAVAMESLSAFCLYAIEAERYWILSSVYLCKPAGKHSELWLHLDQLLAHINPIRDGKQATHRTFHSSTKTDGHPWSERAKSNITPVQYVRSEMIYYEVVLVLKL